MKTSSKPFHAWFNHQTLKFNFCLIKLNKLHIMKYNDLSISMADNPIPIQSTHTSSLTPMDANTKGSPLIPPLYSPVDLSLYCSLV